MTVRPEPTGARLPHFEVANRIRRGRTSCDFSAFGRRVEDWAKERDAQDTDHQHHGQIDAIKKLVSTGTSALGNRADGIAIDRSPWEVYDECRLFDLRLTWLNRVWDFFRDKLEQRERADYETALSAADQVVWSCHREPLSRVAPLDGSPPPPSVVPLPFVESRYAFEAFPPTTVPPDLANDAGFIGDYLERLPMGLIRLPPAVLHAPWWLVLVAHETGHTLERDLAPGLHDAFATAIRGAIADPEDASWWARWAPEVFADVVSVMLAGPWALQALMELEPRRPPEMVVRRGQYPPAMVRLELLERVARELHLEPGPMLDEIRADVAELDAALRRDRALIDRVLEVCLAPLPEVGASLEDLCDVRPAEFADDGVVDRWATSLGGGGTPTGAGVRAARLMACAALDAWSRLDPGAGPQERRRAENDLAKRALSAIAGSRDGTFRDTQDAPAEATLAAEGLATALLAAGEEQLLGSPRR